MKAYNRRMGTTDHRLHPGARSALTVAAVLCMILIVGIPFGVWILIRVSGGKVSFDDRGLTARALGSLRVDFADVTRIGLLRVPIVARGIGGALARKKVGGNEGINLCFQTRAGKTKKFLVSQFEHHEEIVAEAARRVGKPVETLKMGLISPSWPKLAA